MALKFTLNHKIETVHWVEMVTVIEFCQKRNETFVPKEKLETKKNKGNIPECEITYDKKSTPKIRKRDLFGCCKVRVL